MSRALLIAVGSPQQGDDIAWGLVDALMEDTDLNTSFDVLKVDRPASQLIEAMAGHDAVMILDATEYPLDNDIELLSLARLQEEEILLSSHGFGVAESLQLAGALGKLPSQLSVVALSTEAEMENLLQKYKVLLKQMMLV